MKRYLDFLSTVFFVIQYLYLIKNKFVSTELSKYYKEHFVKIRGIYLKNKRGDRYLVISICSLF